MGLGEILDRIRAHYISRLTEAVEQVRERPGVTVLPEPALRDAEGEVVGEGALGLPLRVDLAVLSEGKVAEMLRLESERMLTFSPSPLSFRWENRLEVTLHPFSWDGLLVTVPAAQESTEWRPLVEWFWEWFRADEDG